MLGLTDLKQTRFYQEAFIDGVQQTKKDFVQRLASRGNSLEEIAELVELPLDVVQQILQSSDRSQT
ncbi:MAG: hypothetical protein F6K32_07285 [Desertifilum sp. SIO1I2]|nr:hypothetical protein [Desertifilum sp. SIO1I2]